MFLESRVPPPRLLLDLVLANQLEEDCLLVLVDQLLVLEDPRPREDLEDSPLLVVSLEDLRPLGSQDVVFLQGPPVDHVCVKFSPEIVM